MSIDIEARGDVRIVRWDDGENRVNVDSMTEWHAALDQLEAIEGPLAVVVTGTGKYFSNGLDLDRFAIDPSEVGPTIELLQRLFGRLLVFPGYGGRTEWAHVRGRRDDLVLFRRAGDAQRPRLLVFARGRPRVATVGRDDRGRLGAVAVRSGPGRDAHGSALLS